MKYPQNGLLLCLIWSQLTGAIWGQQKAYYTPTNITAHLDFSGAEKATAISVGPNGNIAIGANDGYYAIIARITAAGVADWLDAFAPLNPGDEVSLVGLANDGNVYGLYDYKPNGQPQRTVVGAFDSQKNLLWSDSIVGSQTFNEDVYSTGIDVNNGVLAISAYFFYSGLSSIYNDQFGIAVFQTDGQLLRTESGLGNFRTENGSRGLDVAVNSDGEVYVAGVVEERNSLLQWDAGVVIENGSQGIWNFAAYNNGGALNEYTYNRVSVNNSGDLVTAGKKGLSNTPYLHKIRGEHSFKDSYSSIGNIIDIQLDELGRIHIFTSKDGDYYAYLLDGAGNIITETKIGDGLPLADARAYFTPDSFLHIVATYDQSFTFNGVVNIPPPQGGSGTVYLRYQVNPNFERGILDVLSNEIVGNEIQITISRINGATDGDIYYLPELTLDSGTADETDFIGLPLDEQMIPDGDNTHTFTIEINPNKLRLGLKQVHLEFSDYEGGSLLSDTITTDFNIPENMGPWVDWMSNWYEIGSINDFDSMGLYLDLDNDGRNNIFEFAMGCDPTKYDSNILALAPLDGNSHEVSYKLPTVSHNFKYTLRGSYDLKSWQDLTAEFLKFDSVDNQFEWHGYSRSANKSFYYLDVELMQAP